MAIASFGIEKEGLQPILHEVHVGKVQLPDFQRGWVWDDAHIRSLLASISLGYPIGTIMMLRTGGDQVRFKHRPLEGVVLPNHQPAERLILDGQQRLTSLYQALMLDRPVSTRDERGEEVQRWYYIDMRKALESEDNREEAIIALPADRIVRTFRNEIVADYSTPEKEYEALLFPMARVFREKGWRTEFQKYWKHDSSYTQLWDAFDEKVIERFQQYLIPVIELAQDIPKAAVCYVFEKVNTGGVSLTVFDLLTATFAADGYELRKDWEERRRELRKHRILSAFSETDFLHAVTLLSTWDRRRRNINDGSGGDRTPAIGCRREHMLRLSLEDYKRWADRVMTGLFRAEQFLHKLHIYDARFLPYGSQLIPLAAILASLDKDWNLQATNDKLARWFWCGVFGELYGGTTETRFSHDLPDVLDWLEGGPEPRTVVDAVFTRERLRSLRRRVSAAYKGIYALLLREGARDLRTGEPLTHTNYFDELVDIHHIFPQSWCRQNNIGAERCDSIVNKTPLTARTNRVIGGRAPSEYLDRIQTCDGITADQLDAHLRTHLIDPVALRANDFHTFFEKRQKELLRCISEAMGKPIDTTSVPEPDEPLADYEAEEAVYDDGRVQAGAS